MTPTSQHPKGPPPRRRARPRASAALRDQVHAALDGLPVTSRPMFGGFGFYFDGAFFGVISDGHLYFRTDDTTRPAYLERGMPPLQPKHRPRGPKTVDRNFQVPHDILADQGRLKVWALTAAAAAPPAPGRAPGRGTPHRRS